MVCLLFVKEICVSRMMNECLEGDDEFPIYFSLPLCEITYQPTFLSLN